MKFCMHYMSLHVYLKSVITFILFKDTDISVVLNKQYTKNCTKKRLEKLKSIKLVNTFLGVREFPDPA